MNEGQRERNRAKARKYYHNHKEELKLKAYIRNKNKKICDKGKINCHICDKITSKLYSGAGRVIKRKGKFLVAKRGGNKGWVCKECLEEVKRHQTNSL